MAKMKWDMKKTNNDRQNTNRKQKTASHTHRTNKTGVN